ncbi:MAG: hypothetical protein R3Y63_02005 [Eubacteriales bacterium]
MTDKKTPSMAHWNLIVNDGKIILNGAVYGHPQIADGRKVTTSPLASGELVEEAILFSTRNSQYLCPLEEVDPTCQLTKKYLLEQLPSEKDRWDLLLNGDPSRPHCPLFSIKNLPIPDGAYILALDAQRPYLFYGMFRKTQGQLLWEIRHPLVHVGMFTDSVLSRKMEGEETIYDIRYFPKGSAMFRFYQMELCPPITPFYVINVGTESVQCLDTPEIPQIQELTLQPWEYCHIPPVMPNRNKNTESDPKEECVVREDFSIPNPEPHTMLEDEGEVLENREEQTFLNPAKMTEREEEIAEKRTNIPIPQEEPSLFEEISTENHEDHCYQATFSETEDRIPELKFEDMTQDANPEVAQLKLDLAPSLEEMKDETDK